MISKKVQEFFKKLKNNEEMAKEFWQASSVEDIQKLADKTGIELTETELEEARKTILSSMEEQELSADDLDQVAGGNDIVTFLKANPLYDMATDPERYSKDLLRDVKYVAKDTANDVKNLFKGW